MSFPDFDFTPPTVNAHKPRAYVEFFNEADPHPGLSAEAGRPVHVNREKVKIINPGSRDETVTRVTEEIIAQYPEEYRRWKETARNAIEGTPLEMWPVMTPALVLDLKYQNIFTVESLATCSDIAIQKLGHGFLDLRQKARAYLEVAKDTAAVQKYASDNEQLRRDIEMLKAEIVKISARSEKK
jgi:hypothetical protein